MNRVDKTWFEGPDSYMLSFYYNPDYLSGRVEDFESFEFINCTPIEHGNFDPDELAFWPSNYDIVIRLEAIGLEVPRTAVDFEAFLDGYSKKFPFNFKEVCFIEYFINGVIQHQGIINNVDFDERSDEITITVSSAAEFYKYVALNTIDFLEYMHSAGLTRHTVMFGENELIFYGFPNARINPGGAGIPANIELFAGDTNFNLKRFIELVFTSVNKDAKVTMECDWRWHSSSASGSDEEVTFGALIINYIHQNILGKHILTKLPFRLLVGLTEADWDLTDTKVTDGGETFYLYSYKPYAGMEDKNLIEVIKSLCRNFYWRACFESFDEINLVRKSHVEASGLNYIDNNSIAGMVKKSSFVPALKYLIVKDHFHPEYDSSERGNFNKYTGTNEKLEIDIYLNAYAYGNQQKFFSLAFMKNKVVTGAMFVKEPGTNQSLQLSYLLAELEWAQRSRINNKVTMPLWSRDFKLSKNYSYDDERKIRTALRPMRLVKNEDTNCTEAEFVEITTK